MMLNSCYDVIPLDCQMENEMEKTEIKFEILDFSSTYIETKFLRLYFVNSKKVEIRDTQVETGCLITIFGFQMIHCRLGAHDDKLARPGDSLNMIWG